MKTILNLDCNMVVFKYTTKFPIHNKIKIKLILKLDYSIVVFKYTIEVMASRLYKRGALKK